MSVHEHRVASDPSPSPDQSFGDACWDALTPEYRAWVTEASDDWVLCTCLYYEGKSELDEEASTVLSALLTEADRRGIVRIG